VKRIRGFSKCPGLLRIEIPNSLEEICGFDECVNLSNIKFSEGCRVKRIRGFSKCPGLSRIEIPVGVEVVKGFNDCPGLQEIRFVEGSQIKQIFELNKSPNVIIKVSWNVRMEYVNFKVWIEYPETNEVKQGRRKLELGTAGYFEQREVAVSQFDSESSENENYRIFNIWLK
jgi:hypothetical protein